MSRGPGNTKDKVDRQLLHEYLWKNRGRGDMMMMGVGELAEKLGVTIYTMSTIMRELRDTGRVQKVRGKYQIFDPSEHAWTYKD
jgi:DNA-binding MarR family transcriptional regulator